MNANANGSKESLNGTTVASTLIGQSLHRQEGQPADPVVPVAPVRGRARVRRQRLVRQQLGPNNPDLIAAIKQRKAIIEKTYGVTAAQIPADAVTASGSGLDPDISPAYAAPSGEEGRGDSRHQRRRRSRNWSRRTPTPGSSGSSATRSSTWSSSTSTSPRSTRPATGASRGGVRRNRVGWTDDSREASGAAWSSPRRRQDLHDARGGSPPESRGS